MGSLDFELKEWDASRRYVAAEMVLLTATTAALVWLAPALAAGTPVLHFLLLVLLVAHATGSILLVQHAVTLLIRPRVAPGSVARSRPSASASGGAAG